MPMTKQTTLGGFDGSGAGSADMLKDERLAMMVSAYLDDRLSDKDLEEFEALLESNPGLAREVREMRGIESQLKEMGTDILFEPVPDALLKALAPLKQR
jgi:anti-sigma factor RsiW